MKRTCLRILPVLLVLALGLLTGSALPRLLHMGTGSYAGLASEYAFRAYENADANGWDLFFYVSLVRLRTLLILWMSSFSTLGMLFHLGYAWWIAASGAMLLSLFGLRDGFQGMALFACSILPQWILYGILWKREADAWMERLRGSFGECSDFGTAFACGGASGRGRRAAWKIGRKDFSEFVSLVVICLFGCACEAFLGTWTLRLYLRL
ncbi:MAG: hypothetical protein LUI13_14315 [Lachnospiraceae bacterium]|nr:hypothetical protein [Lachnospiraceae bacterium]